MHSSQLSKEDYKRQKDLEAARKAGTAPAEKDEEGRDINPHIPQYIAKPPWYLDTGRPTLKHQRFNESSINEKWYARGVKRKTATKFRKGSCNNCGAMTHKTKDCMERPRRIGAKWTNDNIAPDEVITDLDLTYDGKRDRWNGYDPNEYAKVTQEWELVEEERKKIREKELEKKLKQAASGDPKAANLDVLDSDSDIDKEDEDKYAEQVDMPGQKVDTKTRTTVRNLRIREDTAKYLRNLDVNSAYYDPKTRSMRDNPLQEKNPQELVYAGDNFYRYSGDAPKMAKLQLFAWQAQEKGTDICLNADPTRGELLYQEFEGRKEKVKDINKEKILAKYGGEEHLKTPPVELLQSQTENYVEYSRTGQVVRGQEKAKARSKYEEDVFINNHSSVWGSYWHNDQWGYKCCHSFIRNSYCTGLAGIEAEAQSSKGKQMGMAVNGSG